MAIDYEKYEEIMVTALENASNSEKAVPRTVYWKSQETGWEAVSLGTYFNDVYNSYKDMTFADAEQGKKSKSMVFAASHALEIAYDLFACEEIKNEFDNIFAQKDNILLEGVSDKEKAELPQEMKDMVDKQVIGAERFVSERQLVDAVKSTLEEYRTTARKKESQFLPDTFSYMNWINDMILKENRTPEEVANSDFPETRFRKVSDKESMGLLKEAVQNYANSITDTLDRIDAPFLSGNTSLKYDKHDKDNSVNPYVFLEHYKADPEGLSNLTKEAKKWVNDRVNRIMNEAQAIYETGAGHNARVTISDFYANGERLVSEQDATKEDKAVQSSAKVMAALLEGKDVVAQPKDLNLPLHITPPCQRQDHQQYFST